SASRTSATPGSAWRRWAKLVDAVLIDANIHETNFRNADLTRAVMPNAGTGESGSTSTEVSDQLMALREQIMKGRG
ncbi:MAG: hypothetical protein EA366_03720, partial [Spirulina sp. DLM2.Bin59]